MLNIVPISNVNIGNHEDYERDKAVLRLMRELEEGRKSGEQQGWIITEDVRKHFGAKNR